MKSTSLIVLIVMILFGGFIGFDRSGSTVNAGPSPHIIVQAPEVNLEPLNLNVDLNTGQMTVAGSVSHEVNITVQADPVVEIRPVYKTKKVEVPTVNVVKTTRLLKNLAPIKPTLVWPEGTESYGIIL